MNGHKENPQVSLKELREKKYVQAATENLGMEWYKFVIYYTIFFSTLSLIIETVQIFTEYPWDFFYTEDVIILASCSLYNIGLIAWLFITRHWLVRFKTKGIVNYFIVSYGSGIVGVLFNILEYMYVEDNIIIIKALVITIVLAIKFVLEMKYWKKRMPLFERAENKTMRENNNCYNESSYGVIYCWKCGEKNVESAVYCKKCGTKVDQKQEQTDLRNEKRIEPFPIYIFEKDTGKIRKEKRNVDTLKIPPQQFADNGTYYAVEETREGKKVRIYYTKLNWYKQIESGIDISEKNQ